MRSKYGNALSDDEMSQYAANEVWVSANTRHTINGYMFGNLNEWTGMMFPLHSRVRWNLLSMTRASLSYDSFSWEHNNVKDSTGHNTDYCTISSPGYGSMDMKPSTLGASFLFYNTNDDKRSSGMIGMYTVVDDGSYPDDDSSPSSSSSREMDQGTYSFAIVVIVLSVVGVIGLFLYSVSSSSFHFFSDSHGGLGDMSPIFLESSHHMIHHPQPTAPSSAAVSSVEMSPSKNIDQILGQDKKLDQSPPAGGTGTSKAAGPSKVIYHVKHAEI
jgi:hypothetical protein